MDSFDNVRKAFAPLGKRLHFFEAGLHLIKNNEYSASVNQHEFYYIDMIDKVGADVNNFDSFQVYAIANEYLTRTFRMKEILSCQREEYSKIPAAKWEMWENEIYEYLNHLLAILEAREEVYQENVSTKSDAVIEKKILLPENFSIKEMQVNFKPTYSHSAITMLMYYMSKTGIMPPYEQGEFAKIANVFGFHGKTIARDIRYLNPDSKTDLIEAKKVVEALLKNISEDLVKANKR